MRILFLLLSLFSYSSLADQKPIVIAVIDTGFTQPFYSPKPNFCAFGHADVTLKDPKIHQIPKDSIGHGTHIVYTIEQQLKDVPKNAYCIVVLKYYDETVARDKTSVSYTIKAMNRAINMGASIINYSSAGDARSDAEKEVFNKALSQKIVIVTAAGNESARLVTPLEKIQESITSSRHSSCFFKERTISEYPANYDDRIIVVGNLNQDRTINKYSNWGLRINAWEVGTDILAGGVKMSGTSQATAVHTGKIVKYMIEKGR